MKKEKLIPLERVLEDMNDDSSVAYEARIYYYEHYASEEERIYMDKEDKITSYILYGIAFIPILMVGYLVWRCII